jgi:hypothetical protein
MGRGLIVDRHGIKMAAVVCMSIIVFFAMALVPPIANADCPDVIIRCIKVLRKHGEIPSVTLMGKYTTGTCWYWYTFIFCTPCASAEDLDKQCNDKFPECRGRCKADFVPWWR